MIRTSDEGVRRRVGPATLCLTRTPRSRLKPGAPALVSRLDRTPFRREDKARLRKRDVQRPRRPLSRLRWLPGLQKVFTRMEEEMSVPIILTDADGSRRIRKHTGRAEHGSHLAARDHCLSPARAVDRPIGTARYGRMFPGLDPLGTDTRLLIRAGASGGICDAAAVLESMDPGADDADEAAGWPFFGQLIAHDITADRSPLTGGAAPEELRNARVPTLNLEMIYSDGPIGSPYLFDVSDPAKFLLSLDGDVPRNPQGVALIGDPRNDVHLFALTLHIALLHAHNRIVDRLRGDGVPETDVVDRARSTLTWHYQWIVIHDFLPRLVGGALVEQVLTQGGRWFAPPPMQGYIPLEFADAAFRYGHSQIRHTYRLVDGGPAVPLFPDLVGFGPRGRRLDLTQIFDTP